MGETTRDTIGEAFYYQVGLNGPRTPPEHEAAREELAFLKSLLPRRSRT